MLIPSRCGLFYLYSNLKEKLMSKRKTKHIEAWNTGYSTLVINHDTKQFLWVDANIHYLVRLTSIVGKGVELSKLSNPCKKEWARICL